MTRPATQGKKAVLINATARQVVDVRADGLQDWYNLLGVNMVESVLYLPSNDCVMVDEEGLLKPAPVWFTIEGGHQPFAGSGLIVGTDLGTGNTIDCHTTADQIRSKVRFHTFGEVRAMVAGGGPDPTGYTPYGGDAEPPTNDGFNEVSEPLPAGELRGEARRSRAEIAEMEGEVD